MEKRNKNIWITRNRFLSLILAAAMALSLLSGITLTVYAGEGDVNIQTYGDFIFTKTSNPSTGSKQADGINTNDITGFSANRLNSYAWAVTTRGDSIYIGTNRTLFGSALNAVGEVVRQQNPNLTDEMLGTIVKFISGGDVPVNLKEEDYIPQIIKFDTKKGTTEVVYQPRTAVGEDGRLYYTDKDGVIVPNADVTSETASFRSVIQLNGNMYFGSLGANMLQLVRVDQSDNAEVVFQTIGLISSLRACCTYDAGNGETIYFGGQDATNPTWLKYCADHPDDPKPLPIAIRCLDPATAGTDHEDWSNLVADFTDFGKYSYATVYSAGGGNVWDLCSFNGKLYLILAYDGGWALFRGEKGGASPNKFGWTWTEVVGDNGKYPLAMNPEVAVLNEQYRVAYGCGEYGPSLKGSGLLESTATPYVYNGKMYLGTFDNATTIQSETVIKLLTKLKSLTTAKDTGDFGPSLTQLFAPIYEVLSHPQHVWVMDENETIKPVESANKLLEGTTNDYVWRFIEHDGKLYTGTFDSSTAFIYFLDYSRDRICSLLEEKKSELPDYLQQLLNGTFSGKIGLLLTEAQKEAKGSDALVQRLIPAAVNASSTLEEFLDGEGTAEELLGKMETLQAAQEDLEESAAADPALRAASPKEPVAALIPAEANSMIDWLLNLIDIEGLKYWAKARSLAKNAETGFDIFVTEDGENWDKIVGNGLNDPYNYGARTFTICNDELYVGTANPYYGAQLWKVTDNSVKKPAVVVKKPAATKGMTYNGSVWKLLTAGTAEGGAVVYALGDDPETIPDANWSESIPGKKNAGTYSVCWKVKGDKNHLDAPGGTIKATIEKAAVTGVTKPKAKTLTYNGKAQQLVTAGKCTGGTVQYSLDNKTFKKTIPTATKAGSYKVYWKIVGDSNHKNTSVSTITAKINKAKATITVKTPSKTYKASALKSKAQTFSIGASVNSKGTLSYKVEKYGSSAAKKYLSFNTKNGKVTVKKGTPKGSYSIKVKISAKATANYNAATLSKTIKVTVK